MRAFDDLDRGGRTGAAVGTKRQNVLAARDALRWVLRPDLPCLFSFSEVCSTLGIDVTAARAYARDVVAPIVDQMYPPHATGRDVRRRYGLG